MKKNPSVGKPNRQSHLVTGCSLLMGRGRVKKALNHERETVGHIKRSVSLLFESFWILLR
jgi:hypothetical protein